MMHGHFVITNEDVKGFSKLKQFQNKCRELTPPTHPYQYFFGNSLLTRTYHSNNNAFKQRGMYKRKLLLWDKFPIFLYFIFILQSPYQEGRRLLCKGDTWALVQNGRNVWIHASLIGRIESMRFVSVLSCQ